MGPLPASQGGLAVAEPEHGRAERRPGALEGARLELGLQRHVGAHRIDTSAYHPLGTCRMGTDAEAVVDSECRLNAVEGLRVVDASVMPRVTTGNLYAPTVMIAEKASDLILAA